MRYFNVMVLGPSQSPYEGNLLFILCYFFYGEDVYERFLLVVF